MHRLFTRLATPILAITLILVMAERILNLGLFDPARGGDPLAKLVVLIWRP